MNTNFAHVLFDMGSSFHKADLSGANMSNAFFRIRAEFWDANLKNVDFSNARFHLADFSGANLEETIFDGADLYAATFIDVKGIDEAQRKSLERRAARWFYDFTQNFYDFLSVLFFPGYLLVIILAVILSITGLLKWEKKIRAIVISPNFTKSFVAAFFMNGFAVLSTLCTFLMMFSGGHSTRQMTGSMEIWRAWLHFFPIPVFSLLICIVLSFVLLLFAFVLLFRKRNGDRPWKLFFYLVLTFVHVLLAFNWLFMFMPDA